MLPEPSMIVCSAQMQIVVQQLRKVARIDFFPVMITGETGVGKQEAADFIHVTSNAIHGKDYAPFVDINCSGLSHTLLESELFGHELGAFTGAVKERIGLLESAAGGTVFLDEVGDASLKLQRRLLKYLDTGLITRVGGNNKIEVRTRVIAATNKNLQVAVARRKFKEDLYYRLNTFAVHIPPLRERPDDIEPLVVNCIHRFNAHRQTAVDEKVTEPVRELLMKHPWPGNVRELFNVVERAMVNCEGKGTLDPFHFVFDPVSLPPKAAPSSPPPVTEEVRPPVGIEIGFRPIQEVVREAGKKVERDYLLRALEHFRWNRKRTSEALDVSYKALLYKIKEHGLGSVDETEEGES